MPLPADPGSQSSEKAEGVVVVEEEEEEEEEEEGGEEEGMVAAVEGNEADLHGSLVSTPVTEEERSLAMDNIQAKKDGAVERP